MKKILCIRSQHSKGSSKGHFGGPDTYVAVQIVPDGVAPLFYLNSAAAARRGITIKYFCEGYHEYRGKRSQLGQALARAQAFIATTD